MAERPSPSRKGKALKPERAEDATNHHPKGTPTEERHDSEVAGGQVRHDQPLTTAHPAGGKQTRGGRR